MKKLLIITILVILTILTIGCRQNNKRITQLENEVEIKAIRYYFEQLSSTINNGDIDGWINLFSDDIIKMQPNGESVKGKEAVLQWVLPWFNNFNLDESVFIDEIKVNASWAFAMVNAKLIAIPKKEGETIQLNGKAIWILKRQKDDSWKCTHHIWNYNHPVQSQK